MDPTTVLERSVEAHGGMERWSKVSRIDVNFSAGGIAFASKLKAGCLRDRRAKVVPKPQEVTLEAFPKAGTSAVMNPFGVSLSTKERIITEESEPRRVILDKRPAGRWSHLDLAYFTGCALWTYLTAPFLVLQERFEILDSGFLIERGEKLDWIGFRYPEWAETHSLRQTLFFSRENGLLRRHDYTAEAFSDHAHAANRADGFTEADGFVVATERRVTPARRDRRARRGPTLVSIRIHNVSFNLEGRS